MPPPRAKMNAVLDGGAVKAPAEIIAVVTSVPAAGVDPSGMIPLENVNSAVGLSWATPTPPRTYGMTRLLMGTSTRNPPRPYQAERLPPPMTPRPWLAANCSRRGVKCWLEIGLQVAEPADVA